MALPLVILLSTDVFIAAILLAGKTTISGGIGSTIALFIVLLLATITSVWMFWAYTVRNLQDLAAERRGISSPLEDPKPVAPWRGRLFVTIAALAVVAAFFIPALALLDR